MNYYLSPVDGVFQDNSFLNEIASVEKNAKVLLLQGPVGPFFLKLQDFLEAQNIDVQRVCFNAGDRFFSKRAGRLSYSGTSDEWKSWIDAQLSTGAIDCIIMFGSERFAHKIARTVAIEKGIRVVALEEGYIRPGYVTIEEYGNNANSPLAGKFPNSDYVPSPPIAEIKIDSGFYSMCCYAATYFTLRGLLSFGHKRKLFHRDVQLVPDVFYWMRNLFRRAKSVKRDSQLIQRLVSDWDKKYYLVPLQVSMDSNIKYAGRGWSSRRLISEAIASFSRAAPSNTRLVFKIHPMERGHNSLNPVIRSEAAAFGISERVDIIETGLLGNLVKHSSGMITVNSTSGMSAIYHGVPIMAVGDAVYTNPKLTICSMDNISFDTFWKSNHVADAKMRHLFLSWVKELALKPGDYYSKRGMKIACASVLQKLDEMSVLRK